MIEVDLHVKEGQVLRRVDILFRHAKHGFDREVLQKENAANL